MHYCIDSSKCFLITRLIRDYGLANGVKYFLNYYFILLIKFRYSEKGTNLKKILYL